MPRRFDRPGAGREPFIFSRLRFIIGLFMGPSQEYWTIALALIGLGSKWDYLKALDEMAEDFASEHFPWLMVPSCGFSNFSVFLPACPCMKAFIGPLPLWPETELNSLSSHLK